MKKEKLSTGPYKGVRDFYPEDQFIQRYIFDVWEGVAESFGYNQYNASILEPSELYSAKSGEEIVNEQTYAFKDRGDREVTLRPEMTPTVARMVAGKLRELPRPIRWYSIPNLFRYENPQRGRLREHFQLNVDIFGVESTEAEIEIISLAYQVMRNFGAEEKDFVIKINSRKIINDLFSLYNLSEKDAQKVSKILDKKEKISKEVFEESLEAILEEQADEFIKTIRSGKELVKTLGEENESVKKLINLIESLTQLDIGNILFTPTLVRGFDYYTDIVFEIFDTDPENNRALFGGGRYDNLLEIFGGDTIPAVGFGMGDVTLRHFLETRELLPEYHPPADLYICRAGKKSDEINKFTQNLRNQGVNVAVDLTEKKIGDQIKSADKQKIPFVLCIGDEELSSGEFKIRNLKSGEEKTLKEEEIPQFLKNTDNS